MKPNGMAIAVGGLLFMGALQGVRADTASETYRIQGKAVTLAHYSKAFVGPGNVRVEVAPYKSADGKEGAILAFHGVESKWDGKAINHAVQPAAYDGAHYVATYNGKPWHTLQMSKVYGEEQWTLFLPDVKNGITLTPSDGAAQLTNPRELFQQYQAQQKEGK